jgi:hypothetical protein
MGGDLNLKKSWHPHLRKNQERVWKEEKSALEERKLIEKLRKEREEERQTEELQRLHAESGGKVVTKRVDWMYSGPSGDGAAVTEEREGYLLGKRRIDHLLKSNDTQSLQKGAAIGVDAVGDMGANTARDTQKKVLADPLLMIQKQKMEMQLKAVKDAQKQAKYEEKRTKEKERDRKHKDKERHRDRSRDRSHKHRSRRDDSRSRSNDYEDRDRRDRKHRRHDRDEKDDRSTHRRCSRSRSRSPYRKSHRDNEGRRSRSPRRREDREERDNYRRRDRTPPLRSFDKPRRSTEEQRPYRPRHSPPATTEERPYRPRPSPQAIKEEPKESIEERLAKMQAAASSLEEQRAERVRQQGVKDAEEEAKLKQNNKDGGRRFVNGVRGQAADMDLGEAIARGRQNYRTEVDA